MAHAENHLIELLPRKDRVRLLGVSQTVQLPWAEVIGERGAPALHVYFPIDGFISLITRIDQHSSLEVGMVGREGMLGAHVALDLVISPLDALVQGVGTAHRIGTGDLRRELARSVALKRTLQRYLYVLMVQMTTSVACLRFHNIGPRLARWLLMSQDRAHADHFRVTHDSLACMLGVRRVGVTVAAGELQSRGLIEYHRGELNVLDRRGLEASACSCYETDRRAYSALL